VVLHQECWSFPLGVHLPKMGVVFTEPGCARTDYLSGSRLFCILCTRHTSTIRLLCQNNMHPYVAVPATLALVWRAWSKKSLTPAGIVAAILSAVIHAIHPWSVFFALLVVFFLSGTAVTKVSAP